MTCETGQPALHDDLMARVFHRVNLWQAWKRVKRNRGAPGVDGIRIEDWPAHARQHWAETGRQLEAGSYPKGDPPENGTRDLAPHLPAEPLRVPPYSGMGARGRIS